MGVYRVAQICLNGHMINDRSDSNSDHNAKFCTKCGQPTITTCPVCNAKIRGYYYVEGVFRHSSKPTPVPKYCHECGTAYPWTQSILDNALELLSLDVDLDSDTKKIIQEAIPNLIVETPSTSISIEKYKLSMDNVSQFVKDGLANLLVSVVSDGVKNILFSIPL